MSNKKIYQGTNKTLYQSGEEYALLMSFNDSVNVNDKTHTVSGKGIINNAISAHIMQILEMIGIENHLIEKVNMRRQLIQHVDPYPIILHINSIASGRYVSEFGMEKGFVFDKPIIDFKIKNKELKYPAINESQIIDFKWMSKQELEDIKSKAVRIHDFLTGIFAGVNIRLVDIKLEFGRVFNGDDFISMLIDEISPDTCTLWDMKTNEKLCHEIAPDDIEKIIPAYKEVKTRLGI